MPNHVKASPEVRQLLKTLQESFHPHIDQAKIALEFVDSKAYIKDRLNLGKVFKFSKANKLWMPNEAKYDFCISICADVWFSLLNEKQRRAILDLHLTCCQVEYEPNSVVENGKKIVVKDEFGRTEYTDKFKCDDEGCPVWKKAPLDAIAFASNVKRFGVWYDDLMEIKQAIVDHEVSAVEAVNA